MHTILPFFKYERGANHFPEKNLCKLTQSIFRHSAQIGTNNAQKKDFIFVSKFKSGGKKEIVL